jgi:hypothetical protein
VLVSIVHVIPHSEDGIRRKGRDNMKKGAKCLLGTLAVVGGVGMATVVSTPAQAKSCFWVDIGQHGASRCFSDNVSDFAGMNFDNSTTPMSKASSFQNLNWTLNEYVYSLKNYNGQEQELEDETLGNLNSGISDHLGSYDAT